MNRGPLTDKEEYPDCKKVLPKHSLIYKTQKCAAKTKKNIIIENIEQPAVKAAPSPQKQLQTSQQHVAPKNYIDLDGDSDYGHLNGHNIINGYVRYTRDKVKEQKQQKYRSMLQGRL